jgi:acyl dehydratase
MSLSASELHVGDSRRDVVVDDLSRTQLVMYAGASGDYNPLHSDERFATEVAGYPGVFAHGMLTMGMSGRVVTDWVGDGRITRYGVRFKSQVWPGDTLTTTVTVTGIEEIDGVPHAELSVSTVNQDGAEVISGYAGARLDP